jgi:hypothetical protein
MYPLMLIIALATGHGAASPPTHSPQPPKFGILPGETPTELKPIKPQEK